MGSRPPIKSAQTVSTTSSPSDPPDLDEQPTVSERMGAEARAVKATKPKGSPQLWPFAQLPRRRRAQFFAPLRGIDTTSLARAGELGEKAGFDLTAAADTFELLAAAEDALRAVAVPDAGVDYDEWAANASDEDLMGLFQWYMDKFSPGEAKPSSN